MIEQYLKTYKDTFESQHTLMVTDNHQQHNTDPDYWDILLGDVKFNKEKWKGKRAFDFGCGCGRNLVNLSTLAEWETIDGCDISKSNAEYAQLWYSKNTHSIASCKTWESNGKDIQPIPYEYDFIMSHIVFQHISNWSVRYSILTDMYNSLNDGGYVSLHFMDLPESVPYHTNAGLFTNCRVEKVEYLWNDFNSIGYKDIRIAVGPDYLTGAKSYYVKAEK